MTLLFVLESRKPEAGDAIGGAGRLYLDKLH
jgi:hypothetical protein